MKEREKILRKEEEFQLISNQKGGTNYEFSTSNPMWRASLETLDFLPFTTVDYSGGIIITDWYSDNTNSNESIKLTLRFLSNEKWHQNSIKVIVHKKKCSTNTDCVVKKVDSKLLEEDNCINFDQSFRV